jgi:uncharacterized membrane protein YhaH (DUF805 family)
MLGIVAVIFVLGLFLPGILLSLLSASLAQLAPGSPGVQFPVHEGLLSLATGGVLALGAAIGLLRPSRSEANWRKGAFGERRVGRALDALSKKGVLVLHDRLIPGSKGNIDHIAVTQAGVFTVDAKAYRGKLEVRSRGRQLWINGRNRSHLLDQARRQAVIVRSILFQAGLSSVAVTPVLCFVDTELPLLGPQDVKGVILCTPRGLDRRITRRKVLPVPHHQMLRIVDVLGLELRPASGHGRAQEQELDLRVVDGSLIGDPAEERDREVPGAFTGSGPKQPPHQPSPGSRPRRWNWIRIANFTSRARRIEFWAAVVVALSATAVASFVDTTASPSTGLPALIVAGSLVWPFWGASVNRLHDVGRSGWVSLLHLVPLVNLLFLIWLGTKRGEQKPNRWGSTIT